MTKTRLAALVVVLFAVPAFAATARWTGNSRYVTTVTYKQGIACEYDYFGDTFWRTFVGRSVCPISIEVE